MNCIGKRGGGMWPGGGRCWVIVGAHEGTPYIALGWRILYGDYFLDVLDILAYRFMLHVHNGLVYSRLGCIPVFWECCYENRRMI